MNYTERKQEILQKLHERGTVLITDLAEELNVSTMTIRRDLTKLAEEGLVNVEYRGASLIKESPFEYTIQQKLDKQIQQKRKIAQKCLEYIQEGDSIFIEAGTSTGLIAELIPKDMDLLIMTNSLLVANYLAADTKAKVIMCPGEYRSTSMAYLGTLTIEFIAKFKIDTLFIGTEYIDPYKGLSVMDISDGTTKHALIQQARHVICTADSTKFDQKPLYFFADINSIDTVITDSGISNENIRLLEKSGTEVVIV